MLGCLVSLAEDVVVARCDRVDACLIGVRVVRILTNVDGLLLDVEADAVGSVRDVRHGDICRQDTFLNRQAARRIEFWIIIAQLCRIAIFLGSIMCVQVYCCASRFQSPDG